MNSTDLYESKFVLKFQTLNRILGIWSMKDLTPLGKIIIVKSCAHFPNYFSFISINETPWIIYSWSLNCDILF